MREDGPRRGCMPQSPPDGPSVIGQEAVIPPHVPGQQEHRAAGELTAIAPLIEPPRVGVPVGEAPLVHREHPAVDAAAAGHEVGVAGVDRLRLRQPHDVEPVGVGVPPVAAVEGQEHQRVDRVVEPVGPAASGGGRAAMRSAIVPPAACMYSPSRASSPNMRCTSGVGSRIGRSSSSRTMSRNAGPSFAATVGSSVASPSASTAS